MTLPRKNLHTGAMQITDGRDKDRYVSEISYTCFVLGTHCGSGLTVTLIES